MDQSVPTNTHLNKAGLSFNLYSKALATTLSKILSGALKESDNGNNKKEITTEALSPLSLVLSPLPPNHMLRS